MSAPTDQTSPEPKPEPPTEPPQAGPADPAEATAPDSLATASAAPRATDVSGSSDDVITPDILGEPWVARRIPVTESPTKAPGADHAVLVHQREAAGRASRPRHSRAVLYLHGRSDYFFQTHLAQAYLDAGFEFYALDLRACGRAGVGLASPHDVRDLRVHDEEISEALRIIRSEHGHDVVVLNGHSTGGLQAVIWAADHPGTVDAVVLNSPWLDLRGSALVRSYGSAFVDLLSRRDPERVIGEPGSGEEDNYVAALHRRWRGEWDWDLALKPAPSFPVRAGFLAGIRRLQREVHHGLGIRVPILVCCSTVSGGAKASLEEAQRSDVVLDVEQIIDRSQYLGDDVTVRQISDGVHDLALSGPLARAEYLQAVMHWLDNRLH
ncbi:alpha/beta hydrolase [Actinomyces naeslundii]|uniref:alpha/beta hydrolase n=1 Tax=Actinomyces naeslundii TaxID=1655 RepID=UPI0028D7B3B7|nr:alpha/beta hydrolase [Actinomyces naeslundii]